MFIKRITALAMLMCASAATAQNTIPNWQNEALTGTTFGIDAVGMHAAAQGLKPSKKPVVVALIGFGADIEHPALIGNIWTNPKEKPNGRDDDKNGWVDDIHGWNFLGTLDNISREGEREYLRLQPKYGDYVALPDGSIYRYDTISNTITEAPMPADRREFEYFIAVKNESEIAQAYGGVRIARVVVEYMKRLDASLREQFPGRKLAREDFQAVFNNSNATPVERYLNDLVALMSVSAGSDDWDAMLEFANARFVQVQQEGYDRILKSRLPREHETLGDDMYDISDKGYGNGNLKTANADYGTMQAGIIAAHDNSHIQGVAPAAQLMFLRVDAGVQDESRVKDVALAIRYAVDKGAQVIQLGRSNTLYPYPYAQWVDDALRYAEQKGVLLVAPVMDLAYNLDETPFYPNRSIGLNNMITVAASDMAGNPLQSVNFGPGQLDIFAPGADIESAYVDGRYAAGSGSYLAAAMVTGTAAYIKSYFPKITPAQMRELLMSTVTPRTGAEVEKQFYLNGKPVVDLFLFEDLSAANGILNAARAFEKAKEL